MNTGSAASYAIRITRLRNLDEIGPDELLLGCLWALSRFGIAQLEPWIFDLEALGIDWLGDEPPQKDGRKVSYSDGAVTVFDRAARIARLDGCAEMRIEHLLVAFAGEETGLMGDLKRKFGIDSTAWRDAAARLAEVPDPGAENGKTTSISLSRELREYLTPEEAAEALGIHVQTLRAYVRSGKLPALRLAGERSLRIRRSELDKVLEPLVPDKH